MTYRVLLGQSASVQHRPTTEDPPPLAETSKGVPHMRR